MAECKDCADKGSFWAGEPMGSEVKLGSLDAYLAKPDGASNKAVILVPDVYGWTLANTRQLADKFAEAGFYAALANYFGDDEPPMAEVRKGNYAPFMEWRGRHPAPAVLDDIDIVMASLKKDYGVEAFSVIGFCWGGLHAAMLASGEKVKAAAINHGSFVTEEVVEGIKQPILFNATENDQQIPAEKLEKFKGILEKKPDVPSDVKLFHQAHGFSVRGDITDDKMAADIEDAFVRARDWFVKYV